MHDRDAVMAVGGNAVVMDVMALVEGIAELNLCPGRRSSAQTFSKRNDCACLLRESDSPLWTFITSLSGSPSTRKMLPFDSRESHGMDKIRSSACFRITLRGRSSKET